jgi:hypothetical protein
MASPKRSEKSIQKAVVEYARSRGCLAKKLETGRFGSSGWPDYLFLYRGSVLFVEFKREGGKVTALQEQIHEQLTEAGFPVAVVDAVYAGRDLITLLIQGGSRLELMSLARTTSDLRGRKS